MKNKFLFSLLLLGAIGMMSLPALSLNMSFDIPINQTVPAGPSSNPIQNETVTYPLLTPETTGYYWLNETNLPYTTDVSDADGIIPYVEYDNTSGGSWTVKLDAAGSEGIGSTCDVFVKVGNNNYLVDDSGTVITLGDAASLVNGTQAFVYVQFKNADASRCKGKTIWSD